jgi:hypothetical protein
LIAYYPIHRDAPIKNSPRAITVVPGSAQKLKVVKSAGLQPKMTAPTIRITMEISVLNASKSSTSDTTITLQQLDSLVGDTITTQVFPSLKAPFQER